MSALIGTGADGVRFKEHEIAWGKLRQLGVGAVILMIARRARGASWPVLILRGHDCHRNVSLDLVAGYLAYLMV